MAPLPTPEGKGPPHGAPGPAAQPGEGTAGPLASAAPAQTALSPLEVEGGRKHIQLKEIGPRTACSAHPSPLLPPARPSPTACRSLSSVSVFLASPGPRGTASRPFSANRRTGLLAGAGRRRWYGVQASAPVSTDLTGLAGLAWPSSLAPVGEFCPNCQGMQGMLPCASPNRKLLLVPVQPRDHSRELIPWSTLRAAGPGWGPLPQPCFPHSPLSSPGSQQQHLIQHTHPPYYRLEAGQEPRSRCRRADRWDPNPVSVRLPTARCWTSPPNCPCQPCRLRRARGQEVWTLLPS